MTLNLQFESAHITPQYHSDYSVIWALLAYNIIAIGTARVIGQRAMKIVSKSG